MKEHLKLSAPPQPPAEEGLWLEALREGSEVAFEKIYNQYWAKLFSAAYNYTRSRETAQEMVQEVFLGLWQHRQTLKIETSLKAYLLGAMRHKSCDYYDKLAVRDRHAQYLQRQTYQTDSTSDQVQFNELQAVLAKEVEALPETTRRVFVLSRMNDFSVPQIASELHLSGKAVEYHLTKALKHLRLRLSRLLMLVVLWLVAGS
jgi:RNA polymerase sigma-70 factor (ECF subfamily)